MGTLKIIAIVFLSLLLAISLFVFGFLFTMKMTTLNVNYFNSRLDSLPLVSLVEEAEFDETIKDSPELINLMKNITAANEAEIKEQFKKTVYTIYDYLNRKSEELNVALVLKDTIFDASFTISIIQKSDVTPLAKELAIEMTNRADLPYGLSAETHIDDIAYDLEPWLKEQLITNIPPVYDYILGFRQNTDIVIQLEPVIGIMRNYLREDFLSSPPAELAGLSTAELEQKFDEAFGEFISDSWAAIEVDPELLGSNIQSDFSKSLANFEEALSISKQYIGYFNAIYGFLIGFIVLFIAGIILIYREVKGASRTLGGILLSYGIINLIAIFIVRGTAESIMAQFSNIPPPFHKWLAQSTASSLNPLLILAIVLLIIGATLLTVSFIYKRNQFQTGTFE